MGRRGPLQGAIRLMKHKLTCLLVLLTGLALVGLPAAAQDTSTGFDQRDGRGHDGSHRPRRHGHDQRVPSATASWSPTPGATTSVGNLIPGKYTVKGSLTRLQDRVREQRDRLRRQGRQREARPHHRRHRGDDRGRGRCGGHRHQQHRDRLQPELSGLREPARPAARGQPVLPGPGRDGEPARREGRTPPSPAAPRWTTPTSRTA